MKKILLCFVFCFVFYSISFTDENIVTSKTLSINDVKNHIIRINENYKLKEIFGIYQNGNTAKVFYSLTPKSKPTSIANASTEIFRLNSGKWFDPKSGKFLSK